MDSKDSHSYLVEIGKKVHYYRKVAGFSQVELANRSGVTQKAICNMENGKTRMIYPETIDRLAAALDRSPAELLAVGKADEVTVKYEGPHAHLHEALDRIIELKGEDYAEGLVRALEMRGGAR